MTFRSRRSIGSVGITHYTNMYLPLLFFLQVLVLSCARVDLIRDYFVRKNVGRVVGFVCDDRNLGFQIIRALNDVGISASVKARGWEFDFLKFMNVSAWKLGVFVDLRCSDENATDIFRDSSAHRMYGDLYAWLLLGRNLSHSLSSLNDSAFGIFTDLVVSVRSGDRYELYDVYNHCKYCGGSLEIARFGSWREETGLRVALVEGKISRRWNFRGLAVRMTVLLSAKPEDVPLMEYLEDERTKPADSIGRFSYSLLKHLPEMFNFTLKMSAITQWGKNDSLNPLMKVLGDNAADLSCYAMIVTKERLDVARVVIPIWPLRTCFIFRANPSRKIKVETIFRPLAASTWYAIGIFLLLVLLLFSLISTLENREDGRPPRRWDSLLFVVSSLCLQGFPVVSDRAAGRIAFLQVTIFGLLIYNYYSAAIVSARLYEPLEKMNDSLYSLVHNNLQLASDDLLYFRFLLSDPNWEVQYFKNYWYTKVPASERFLTKEDGIGRAAAGGFAYHVDPNEAYPYVSRYFDDLMICQLTEVHLLKRNELAIWASRNGQFLEVSKIGILRMISAGLRVRQLWRWTTRKPFCREDVLSVESITIYEAAPIILILICGFLLSLAVLLGEKLVFRLTLRKTRRTRYPKMKFPSVKKKAIPTPADFKPTVTP